MTEPSVLGITHLVLKKMAATIDKTKVAMAVAPVISAAILGAAFQLVWYPQVVVGVSLLGLGTLMKLLSAWVGIIVLVLVLIVVGVLAVVLHTKLARGLPHAVMTVLMKAGPSVMNRIRKIPPWMLIVAVFGLPALGQLSATLSMVRTLVSVGAESSPIAIGGFSIFSFVITVLVQVFGLFSSAWLQPGKINFLLQTFWIMKTVLSGNFRNSPESGKLWPLLSTILVGWGSVILSSLPDRAVLDAAQAAMRAAMVSGAAAASVTAGVAYNRSKQDQTGSKPQIADSSLPATSDENFAFVNAIETIQVEETEEDKKFNQDFLAALKWMSSSAEKVASKVKTSIDPSLSKIFDKVNSKLYSEDNSKKAALPPPPPSDDVNPQSSEAPVPATTEGNGATEEPEVIYIERPPASVSGTGETPLALTMLLHINPPIGVAVVIAFIRAVPTLIVFLMAELIAIFHLVRGTGKMNGVAFPVMLLPFALAEIFTLVRQVGFSKGLKSIYRLSLNADTDGLSILLWRSPKLLATWNQFKQADNRLSSIGGNLMSVLMYPKQILFPSEEAIAMAPPLEPQVFMKLVSSIVIDIIGVSTFAVPGVGELLDVMWAPVSGFIINQVYGSPGFAFMGFAEEILPFTDILPTATIAWFWLYGIYLPIWIIRIKRDAERGQAFAAKMKKGRKEAKEVD